MFQILRHNLLGQTGSGMMYLSFFLILFLLKNKEWRYKFVWPVYTVFATIVVSFSYENFWSTVLPGVPARSFLMLPIPIVLAFIVSYFWARTRGVERLVATIGVLLVLYFSSDYPTENFYQNYYGAENWYGLPQDVVDVCELVLSEVDEPLLLVNETDVDYFRQYSSKIKLLYGENLYAGKMNGASAIPSQYWKIYSLMSDDNYIDVDQIGTLCSEFDVDYIVINIEDYPLISYYEQEDFTFYMNVGRYAVFRSNSIQ